MRFCFVWSARPGLAVRYFFAAGRGGQPLFSIGGRGAAHIVTYALCVFWTVLTCIEYCCKSYFKSYWGLSFITQMTGNVVGNFFSTMLEIIFGRIVFILLSFLPSGSHLSAGGPVRHLRCAGRTGDPGGRAGAG